MTEFKVHSRVYREMIFWVGVIATVVYRLIIFLNRLPDRLWSDLAWYIGTLGFVWYFAHRYSVEKRRAIIIKERGLEAKVASGAKLAADDQQALSQTLKSLESSKAQWNYIVIFVVSALALLLDLASRLGFFKI